MIVAIVLILLFNYSVFRVSSMCSRVEEKEEE